MKREEILQLFCCQPVAAVMTVIGCFCDCKSVSAAVGQKKKKKMNHLQRHVSFYFFLSLTKINDIYLTVTPLHARLFITKQLRAQRKLKGGGRGTTAVLRCSCMDEISNLFELVIPCSPLSQRNEELTLLPLLYACVISTPTLPPPKSAFNPQMSCSFTKLRLLCLLNLHVYTQVVCPPPVEFKRSHPEA